ncbi:MAG TPA: hypothetical protein PK120_04990 [Syntrophales bacterium]|nr:hypothetical protein [Syntrophales bacterium]
MPVSPSFIWHPFFIPPFSLTFFGLDHMKKLYFKEVSSEALLSAGQVIPVGLLDRLEKALIKKLMKSSEKQPLIVILLVLFISRKKPQKKGPPTRDEAYWRQLGGL